MKTRWWIAVLLLLNAIALAWQWDAFGRWGWGPNLQREPERLKQQIKPEALKITRPGQDGSAPAAASSETPAKLAAASEPEASQTPTPSPAAASPASAAASTPAKPASR
jgi:hypothetical protein